MVNGELSQLQTGKSKKNVTKPVANWLQPKKSKKNVTKPVANWLQPKIWSIYHSPFTIHHSPLNKYHAR